VSVKGSDTIQVLHNGKAQRIRLASVDCPKNKQAFGQRAKQATSSLIFGQRVSVNSTGKDRYGRTLAAVVLNNGHNLNHELVKRGWCWWYRNYAPGDTILEGLEQEARETRKGLWVDRHPLPPWEWRKQSKLIRLNHTQGESLVRTLPTTQCGTYRSPACGTHGVCGVLSLDRSGQSGAYAYLPEQSSMAS